MLTAMGLVGCMPTHDEMAKDYSTKRLKEAAQSCSATRSYACQGYGDDLVGKSVQSRQSDWHQRRDREGAKKAYATCCRSGIGSCCRSIVEEKLASSPEEERAYRIRADFYFSPVRSDAEVAAERETMGAYVAQNEASIRQTRAEERAERARQSAQLAAMARDTATEVQTRIATGKASAPTTPSFTGGAGAGRSAPATDPAIDLAASTAQVLSAAAANPDACRPCRPKLSVIQGVCHAGAPPKGCFEALAVAEECMADASACTSDPTAARAQAAKLRAHAGGMK